MHNKGRIALLMLICMGSGMAGFAISKNLILSCVLLFFSGAALISAFAMISSLVQLITANEMRGRVMSVYNVAFRGGMPFGSIASGWLIPIFSAPVVIAANGLAAGAARRLFPDGTAPRGGFVMRTAFAIMLVGVLLAGASLAAPGGLEKARDLEDRPQLERALAELHRRRGEGAE